MDLPPFAAKNAVEQPRFWNYIIRYLWSSWPRLL